jgi:isocitrate/isopropylmalate dehydrogenase
VVAIEKALESGVKTIDLGGSAKTVEITNAILSNL